LNLTRYVWARRHDFDVIHSHGAYYTHSFIGPLARAVGMGSVAKASLANDDLADLYGPSRPVLGRLHRWMLGRVGACIGISHDLVAEFRAGGMDPRKVHHIPNGVDTSRFHAVSPDAVGRLRESLGLPTDQQIAIYVGVLDARKNIRWLAEQWVAHEAFGTGALLLAVGPGSRDDASHTLRDSLVDLARAHPSYFALHDFDADIAPYYQCSNVLILPSVNEGLPNVVLEAMACGLPCVAARASGSRELVVEGRTGHTYAPGDVEGLAQAVRKCLSVAGEAMGSAAEAVANERYAIDRVVARYEEVYSAVVRRGRGIRNARSGHRQQARTVVYVENGIGYGGAVTCLRHLIRALDHSKFEPIVVTGQSSAPYVEIADDAQWLSIPDRRVDVVAMRRTLEATGWLARVPSARWVLMQLVARLDDFANFLPFFVQLTWFLLRARPDVVHVNNEPLCNRAAVLAASMLGIPLVSHVRGDQFGSRSMAFLFRRPNRFIPVSRWIAESIAELGVPRERSTLIYDGIDFGRFDPKAEGSRFRSAHDIPERAFAVGLPGVLIPWKGHALFLQAATSLISEFPDLHFVIVGGTPDECLPFETELRDYVAQHSLHGRVTFTGHVTDMAGAYSGLDVVVSASTAPEPLGMVVVEAMAMQRPVIAPAHGGALEVVDDEKTGLLFAPNQADSLAAAIRRLRTDDGLRERIAKAGRAAVIEKFSIAKSAREVERLYESLLLTA
jgi:glycosyltransferase involved in cell wall biosynthesis